MNLKIYHLSFLIAILFACNVNAQINTDLIGQIKEEGIRLTELLEWDSTFVEQLELSLRNVERQAESEENANKVLTQLLSHYQSIERNNKSRVKLDFEESLLTWMLPLISFLENPEESKDKITKGLPDTYFPAKTLAPSLLSEEVLNVAANLYPKEILYTVRFMTQADALYEVELAAINAPYEAKQYLHYSNNVNKLLKQSENAIILKLFEVYAKYRFSSKSFYLLDAIYNGEMDMIEAHEASKDKELFYNALAAIYKKEDGIGKYGANEKLSELSDRYVRKVMYQRYLSASQIKVDAFDILSNDAKIYFLFNSHNLLKKKDLKNLAKLFEKPEKVVIDLNTLDWLPVDQAQQFQERLIEESLQRNFDPLIKYTFWAQLRELTKTETYVYEPIKTEVITEEEVVIAEPAFVFKPYHISLSIDDKSFIKFENNPYESLKDLSNVIGKLYSRKILMSLAKDHPVEVMAQLDKFISQPYTSDVIKELAKNAPLTVKNYIVNKKHKIHYFLKTSTDTTIRTLYHIDREAGNWTRAYILLDKIVKQEITYEEAHEICKEKDLLLPHLIEIFKRPEYVGAYSVDKELEYNALDFIRNFNISENTDLAFRQNLNELDAETIYTYLVFGEQEIISNTFKKMYDRLATVSDSNFSTLFESMNYKKIDQFVRMVVHYGKEGDFFSRLDDPQTLFSKVFEGLEKTNKSEVESAVDAADIIISMYDRNRLRAIHTIIRNEYERLEIERNDKGVITYGILASIMAQRLQEGWSVYAAPHYKIPDLVTIPVYSLFNEDLINIQQYYFYNDRDGIASYRNFKKQYEKSNYNWEIKDLGSYVKISSKSGKKVAIYANKPEKGEDGIKALENFLKANNFHPQIVVHRGLSTHTLKTFKRVPSSAKLILDGSCGGFHIQSVALENAPGAHILCNRNIGTMHINDPMFKQISESVRQGKDIIWPNFWSEMEARLGTNPYFKDYIPPHKNVATLILKAYYDVLDLNN